MPGTRKLGRPTDHRRAMLRAMVTYLLENGKIEKNELCKLFDRCGAYMLLRGDDTLKAWLRREERIYGEILGQLKRQGLSCGRRKSRYEEVEILLKECRTAQGIMNNTNEPG